MINWAEYPELNRMWETRGARFCCHQRLAKTNIWINYAIATGSAYVILLSLLAILNLGIFNLEDYKVINIASVVVSVIIIFFSLIEGGKNYVLRSEAMFACAREISVIYHGAEAKIKEATSHPVSLKDEVSEYDKVIDKYQFNHDTLDYAVFRAQKQEVYKLRWYVRGLIGVRLWVSTYGAFVFMLSFVPIILGIVWAVEHGLHLNGG
jgi:hypothetical protein